MADDPFEDLLGLEDDFYEQGFQQGYSDGVRQSRVEARIFGIEKGFEKFVEMGKLQAKAIELQRRIRLDSTNSSSIAANPRLRKHIDTLSALVDTNTLSTENDDDAVALFDDRLKKAQAKLTVIERILGETSSSASLQAGMAANANIEDFGLKR